MMVELATERDTLALGDRISRVLQTGDLVALIGPLGAGKTLLAGAIVRGLGVSDDERVASPTFSLVIEHQTPKGDVLHCDLYRLRDDMSALPMEIARLGLRERRNEGAIVLCEWADGCEGMLGGPAELVVTLEISGSGRRANLAGPRADVL
jgi:tRNA threonylcarbamoyladenosine biosynthesis protein TsaE